MNKLLLTLCCCILSPIAFAVDTFDSSTANIYMPVVSIDGDPNNSYEVDMSYRGDLNFEMTRAIRINNSGTTLGWQNIGSNIYFTDGNVGIGTSTPTEKLQVTGDNPGIKVKSNITGKSAISFVGFYDGSDTRLGYIGDAASYNSDIYVWSESNNNIIIGNSIKATENGAQVHIAPHGGKVGIGTQNPLSALAVQGLPTLPPDSSGNAGIVCATNNGNFWLDNDGTNDCQ